MRFTICARAVCRRVVPRWSTSIYCSKTCKRSAEEDRQRTRRRAKPCHYCGGTGGTDDHIVAKSLGGPDSDDNLVSSCARCNQRKGVAKPTCKCRRCRRAVERYWPAAAKILRTREVDTVKRSG